MGPLAIDLVEMILAFAETRGLWVALKIRELDCCSRCLAVVHLSSKEALARDRLDPAATFDPHDREIGSRG